MSREAKMDDIRIEELRRLVLGASQVVRTIMQRTGTVYTRGFGLGRHNVVKRLS